MRKKINVLFFLLLASFSFSQNFYRVEVVTEGNFGTPNGDVFHTTFINGQLTTSPGLYQTANNTSDFDVLQDFAVFGNKAIIGEKPLVKVD